MWSLWTAVEVVGWVKEREKRLEPAGRRLAQSSEAARVGVADGGDVRGAVGVEEDDDSNGDFGRLVFVGVGVVVASCVLVRVDLMVKTPWRLGRGGHVECPLGWVYMCSLPFFVKFELLN